MQIQEALDCMPSLLTLDDLHLICPAPGDSPDNATAGGSAALVEWLCDVLDSFRPPGKPMLPGMPISPSPPPAPLRSSRALLPPYCYAPPVVISRLQRIVSQVVQRITVAHGMHSQ